MWKTLVMGWWKTWSKWSKRRRFCGATKTWRKLVPERNTERRLFLFFMTVAATSFRFPDIESAMNSIVSLVLYISPDQADPLITLFCDSLVASDKSDSQASLKLKLWATRHHLLPDETIRSSHECSCLSDCWTCFTAWASVRAIASLFTAHSSKSQVNPNCCTCSTPSWTRWMLIMENSRGSVRLSISCFQICQWFTLWDISASKQQTLLRSLHEACMACKQTSVSTPYSSNRSLNEC